MSTATAQGTEAVRLRRAHRKSRQGCSNCKLRRIKCDETKPKCMKCISYGASCSYDPGASDLQLVFTGMTMVDLAPESPRYPLNQPFSIPVSGPPGSPPYRISTLDMNVLDHFQTRTLLTLGTESINSIFRTQIMSVALENPFLLHIILSTTLIHDRHLGRWDKKMAASLAFHWYHGLALFNAKLSGPVKQFEKDALWLAAMMLGAAVFGNVQVEKPEDSWPLTPFSEFDLDWLKMSVGKRVVWNIADPLRPDSIFRSTVEQLKYNVEPSPHVDDAMTAMGPAFVDLFELNSLSTPETNAYHSAASMLAQTFNVDCNRASMLLFFSFISYMDPRYLAKMKERDPRAILLMAYWYAKVTNYNQWWMFCRARLEGTAICMYLERNSVDPRILELLEFPKQVFDNI